MHTVTSAEWAMSLCSFGGDGGHVVDMSKVVERAALSVPCTASCTSTVMVGPGKISGCGTCRFRESDTNGLAFRNPWSFGAENLFVDSGI